MTEIKFEDHGENVRIELSESDMIWMDRETFIKQVTAMVKGETQ